MPTNILMPALSPTMTEGKLAKWQEGRRQRLIGRCHCRDRDRQGDDGGRGGGRGQNRKIVVPAGTEGVKVNAVIAVLLNEGENAGDIKMGAPANAAAAPKIEAVKPESKGEKVMSSAALAATAPSGSRIFVTPLAKRIAADKGIDLKSVKGSGPHGRIVRSDLDGVHGGSRPVSPVPANAPRTASSGPDARTLADAYGIYGAGQFRCAQNHRPALIRIQTNYPAFLPDH